MKYTTKLLKRELIADGTMCFYFEKPADFRYVAGQYVNLTLVNPPETDAEGNTRSISLASAPSEPELMIAMRMRDTAFKRVLKAMPIGGAVDIEGPLGDFVLPEDPSRPIVFLMGGIGITPARSMIVEAANAKQPHELYLFYSNKRPEDTSFLDELMALETQNRRYHFIGTMTEMSKSKQPWTGETGFINPAMLDKKLQATSYLPTGQVGKLQATFYISGPPAMVAAMRNTLDAAGVNPKNIKTEEFSGY